MYISTLSAALLLPILLLQSAINALPSELESRADPASPCSADDEAPTLDGPTSDKSAGLGVEFESSGVIFRSPQCSMSDTNKAKGKLVGNRKGDNWELTADTTNEIAGQLTAEYILDGTQIKIGDGTATAAAAAVSGDLISWDPSADMANNQWNIDGNACNPWKVSNPSRGGGAGNLIWSVQATAPLPFEAINDLAAAAVTNPVTSPLLPAVRPGKNVVSVTKQFFQSTPNGISSDSVKPDVLGFFSLVISYAKAATDISSNPVYSGSSPKSTISIMPRTEFVTLYAQVKSTLPGTSTLYDLVKILACYKNVVDEEEVDLDSNFCDGTAADPKPNSKMDNLGWCLKNSDTNEKDCLKVQDWIASISSGPSPDKLTTLDKLIDGQIGGLGTALENVVGTTRAVPLFEFRNLKGVNAGAMQSTVHDVEQELITYHNKYKASPQRRKNKRNPHGKRQDAADCPITSAPTAAPTPQCTLQNEDPDQGINARGCICGSATLPLLTVTSVTDDAQSCAYTTLPLSGASNPISIQTVTFTSDCKACTLVGGIADTPTCTKIDGCGPTTTVPPPPPPTPTPVCSPGFYGTDTSCGVSAFMTTYFYKDEMNYDVLIFNIAVFIAAIFLLDYGADKFIDHTAIVASRLGVSQTLVALLTAGAEWEELAVVIAAVAQHQSSLAFGNVIGSAISNILAAFSLGLLFQRGHVQFDRSSKMYVTLLLVLTPPIIVLGYFGKGGVIFGSVLIVVFALYLVSIGVAIFRGILSAPELEDSSDDDSDSDGNSDGASNGNSSTNNHSPVPVRPGGHNDITTQENGIPWAEISSTAPPSRTLRHYPRRLRTHVFQLILGFLALSLSGYVLSHSAISIASELNISGTVYGITILAFATTLPEKFIAVIGASRGHSGIVVANTAGSNVFLLTLCLGVVYVSGHEVGTITPFELAVALASVVAFAVIVLFGARRWMGAALLVGYVVFFVLEFTLFRSGDRLQTM